MYIVYIKIKETCPFMSFYMYQSLQQLILPNTLFLISKLFSYKLGFKSSTIVRLTYNLFLPNIASV